MQPIRVQKFQGRLDNPRRVRFRDRYCRRVNAATRATQGLFEIVRASAQQGFVGFHLPAIGGDVENRITMIVVIE